MKHDIITNLKNHVLLATQSLDGSIFERSIIYIFQHDKQATMGVCIHKLLPHTAFSSVAKDMDINCDTLYDEKYPAIYSGGPVQPNRGFVLHSPDYKAPATVAVSDKISICCHNRIVTDIIMGVGPEKMVFCLGYAGWSTNQLEGEIAEDSWTVLPADPDIIFNTPADERYNAFMNTSGLTYQNFTGFAAHSGLA